MEMLLIAVAVTWAFKTAVEKGKAEYGHTREQRASEFSRAHPEWSARKVGRHAKRAARGYWWDQIKNRFPDLKTAYQQERALAETLRAERQLKGREFLAELAERRRKAREKLDEFDARDRDRDHGGTGDEHAKRSGPQEPEPAARARRPGPRVPCEVCSALVDPATLLPREIDGVSRRVCSRCAFDDAWDSPKGTDPVPEHAPESSSSPEQVPCPTCGRRVLPSWLEEGSVVDGVSATRCLYCIPCPCCGEVVCKNGFKFPEHPREEATRPPQRPDQPPPSGPDDQQQGERDSGRSDGPDDDPPPEPATQQPDPKIIPINRQAVTRPPTPSTPPVGGTMPTPTSTAGEAANLEMAKQTAQQLKASAQRDLDAAQAKVAAIPGKRAEIENYGASLASAGVSGPLMKALDLDSDAVERQANAAQAEAAAAESRLHAAEEALREIRKHEEAAERLRATGGAAKETSWYGANSGAPAKS